MENRKLSIKYRSSPVVDYRYDTANYSLPQAVVEAIAEAEGTEPTELKTLYDAVDVDALESVLEHAETRTGSPSTLVGFTAGRWDVFVGDGGHVLVFDPEQPDGEVAVVK